MPDEKNTCEICREAFNESGEAGYALISHREQGKMRARWIENSLGNDGDVWGLAAYIQAHAKDSEAIHEITEGMKEYLQTKNNKVKNDA